MRIWGQLYLFCSLGLISFASCDLIYDQVPTSINSEHPLYFHNYLGNSENIHPKVLYFEEGWGGYEFWMAYTPYPKGNIDAENPCIAVSHDGVVWTVPDGLNNPLDLKPYYGYNSDTHLIYDKENDRIECWWRVYDSSKDVDAVVRRTSADGVVWDEIETMLPFTDSPSMRLSPAVWKEKGIYRMVYSDCFVLKEIVLNILEPSPKWSEPSILPIDWGNMQAWHHDVVVNENGNWEIVVMAFQKGDNTKTADLYYVEYDPVRKNASSPTLILKRSANPKDFDYRSIYRSSLVKVKDEYFLYYSSIAGNNSRYMSVLRGPSLFELRSFTDEEMKCSD